MGYAVKPWSQGVDSTTFKYALIRHLESPVGSLLKLFGSFLLIAALVLSRYALSDALIWWKRLLAFVGGSLVGVLGSAAFSIGRRMTAEGGVEVLLRDRRAPVLYLRPFSMDVETVEPDVHGLLGGVSEDVLAKALARLGPCIAVGRPTEDLPALGFPRLYINEKNWHPYVLELLQKSRLVIVEYAQSAGLSWELTTALSVVNRQRLLLGFRTGALWNEFCSTWNDSAHALSEIQNVRLLGFNSDGSPTIVLAKDRYVSDPSLKAYVSQVPTAESPVWTWMQHPGPSTSSATG